MKICEHNEVRGTKEKTRQFSLKGFLFGGESGIRTPDLRIMIPSL